jgi:hypothetical protein
MKHGEEEDKGDLESEEGEEGDCIEMMRASRTGKGVFLQIEFVDCWW